MDIMCLTREISPTSGSYDVNDCLRPESVLDMFQDAASRHAELLGCGYEEMLAKRRLWILLRTRYEVVRYPGFDENLKISTWPQQGRLDFDRHYVITSESGEVYINGRSKWCVIDADTRRLVKDTRVSYPEACSEQTALDAVQKLAIPPRGEHCYNFRAGLADLDHNGHMNNARYAGIVHNCLDPSDRIKALTVNYLHEISAGGSMRIERLRKDNSVTVWGCQEEAGAEVPCFAAEAELF